ncbi:hypothetical protein [Pandoraea sp. SD6-2]|uniref:hypothetical protein n=1 Tax=Pandoraea sp. SD6-2 TaxID=1286093 RepID=UPI000330FB09|nr:hypothetical protein [Pandoraea sp. SD6-2]EON10846.1 hypothetical protein C266_25250 [Pandoraea sp. SD6-2]
MAHVYPRGDMPFFRYINSSDEHDGGAGESLEHLLFKEAISLVEKTRLSLGKFRDHSIRVTHAETEKEIRYSGGSYFADLYLRFECDSELSVKWSNEVYIEIHKTHLVDASKIDEVRRQRIPMVEITIPDSLLYEFGETGTTDEREEAYRQRIKRMLESDKGFLSAVVLSNPSSVEYLEAKLSEAMSTTRRAELTAKTAIDDVASLRLSKQRLAGDLQAAQAGVVSMRSEMVAANERANAQKGEAATLRMKLITLTTEVSTYRAKVQKLHIGMISMGATIVILFFCLLATVLRS